MILIIYMTTIAKREKDIIMFNMGEIIYNNQFQKNEKEDWIEFEECFEI